jgi:hypothetical protein
MDNDFDYSKLIMRLINYSDKSVVFRKINYSQESDIQMAAIQMTVIQFQ